MVAASSIELVGAKELEKVLMGLDAKLARKLAGKALRAGAKIIQAEAKSLAPEQTGALKAAIKVRAGRNKKGFRSVNVAIGTKWFTGDEFYAAFQEFGWKTGARRNERRAIERRLAAALRRASRAARKSGAGLAAKGSEMRQRQETFFAEEASRRASSIEIKPRRQIEGKHFMERAAEAKTAAAVKAVTDTLRELASEATKST